MRERRRPPTLGSDGHLSGWTHPAIQSAPRTVPVVRRWLRNYQDLKEAIESICELNHELLRPDKTASKARRKSRD